MNHEGSLDLEKKFRSYRRWKRASQVATYLRIIVVVLFVWILLEAFPRHGQSTVAVALFRWLERRWGILISQLVLSLCFAVALLTYLAWNLKRDAGKAASRFHTAVNVSGIEVCDRCGYQLPIHRDQPNYRCPECGESKRFKPPRNLIDSDDD